MSVANMKTRISHLLFYLSVLTLPPAHGAGAQSEHIERGWRGQNSFRAVVHTTNCLTTRELPSAGIPHSPRGDGSNTMAQPPAVAWSMSGNAGTFAGTNFLGTTDDQPLEFKVNGQRALRLEPNLGGAPNVIGGSSSNSVAAGLMGVTIGGGWHNTIETLSYSTTIGGGYRNSIEGSSSSSTIGGGQENMILTNAGISTIAGGLYNAVEAESSTVGGGFANQIRAAGSGGSTISGGNNNLLYSGRATIAGGYDNQIWSGSTDSTISGGEINFIGRESAASIIAGGLQNSVESYSGTISGGVQNSISNNSPYCHIGGGINNTIGASGGAVIGGGADNRIRTGAGSSVIGGGQYHEILPDSAGATISGGQSHSIGPNSTVASIGGGGGNTIEANSDWATIAGGGQNTIRARSRYSTIGGGYLNNTRGFCATVPGGANNYAGGECSFAAGHRAKATYQGDFVWADASNYDFNSSAPNQFAARCTGGAAFITGLDSFGNAMAGAVLPAGSGSWSSVSDRNAKENFEAVDGRQVLERVAAMPISRWNYKTQDKSIRHIGPMAQDFAATFGTGEDDKHIASVDADGVALAAIQGLNAKLEESLRDRDARLQEQNTELSTLRERLAAVERWLSSHLERE